MSAQTAPARVSLVVLALVALAGAVPVVRGAPGVPVGQAAAQSTPPPNPNQASGEAGTGTISGVITDEATGQPLAGAVVYLGPPSHGPPDTPVRQLTDARGRFAFSRLPAFAGYFLQATAGGYFTGHYGRASSGSLGSRIALTEGEWFSEANLAMQRPAVITGRVVDERGDPLVDVYVRVLPRMFVAGRAQLVAGPTTTTDDRGVYRIGGLTPGDYVVQVPVVQGTVPESAYDPPAGADRARPLTDPVFDPSPTQSGRHRVVLGEYPTPLPPVDGRQMAYPPVFYPSSASPLDAATLQLVSGAERTGIDIQMRPVVTHAIRGRLDGPPEAVAGILVRALPAGADHLGQGSEVATAISEGDCAFMFYNVPVGEYTLIAHNAVSQYEASFEIGQSRAVPAAAGAALNSSSGLGVFSGPQGLRLSTRRARGSEAWRGMTRVGVTDADVSDVVIPIDDGASIS
jgi:hypothetical protein